jgi:hypothetical protein
VTDHHDRHTLVTGAPTTLPTILPRNAIPAMQSTLMNTYYYNLANWGNAINAIANRRTSTVPIGKSSESSKPIIESDSRYMDPSILAPVCKCKTVSVPMPVPMSVSISSTAPVPVATGTTINMTVNMTIPPHMLGFVLPPTPIEKPKRTRFLIAKERSRVEIVTTPLTTLDIISIVSVISLGIIVAIVCNW